MIETISLLQMSKSLTQLSNTPDKRLTFVDELTILF